MEDTQPAYQITSGGEIIDVLSETYPQLLETVAPKQTEGRRSSARCSLVPGESRHVGTRRDEDNTLLSAPNMSCGVIHQFMTGGNPHRRPSFVSIGLHKDKHGSAEYVRGVSLWVCSMKLQ